MFILILYGIATGAQTCYLFKHQSEEFQKKLYLTLHALRFALMIASTVVLFTEKGKEVLFGFWILTNSTYFIVETLYSTFFKVMRYCVSQFNNEAENLKKSPTNSTSKEGATTATGALESPDK